jgi:hypothetical protein
MRSDQQSNQQGKRNRVRFAFLGLFLGIFLCAGLGGGWVATHTQPARAEEETPWAPKALIIDCLKSDPYYGVDDDAAAQALQEMGFEVVRYEMYPEEGIYPIEHPMLDLYNAFHLHEYNIVIYYGHGGETWAFAISNKFGEDPKEGSLEYILENIHYCCYRHTFWEFEGGLKVAPNAMIIMEAACFSDGVEELDLEPGAPLLDPLTVLTRINKYSYTFLHRPRPAFGTYVAFPPGGVASFLRQLAKNPHHPIATLAVPDDSAYGASLLEGPHFEPDMAALGMRYRRNRCPGSNNRDVWYHDISHFGAWAGDPTQTFAMVCAGWVPGDHNGDGDNTDPGELGFSPDARDIQDGGDYSCNFFPFLSIANPNAMETPAEITFYDEQGEYLKLYRSIPPNARFTLDLNSYPYLRNKNLSIRVCSLDPAAPLLAERPMYFRYNGWKDGGSDVFGAKTPQTSWYFAEGYASDSFDEYVCLANFGNAPANGRMVLYREGATPIEVPINVAAGTRQTHLIDAYTQGNVSVEVTTDNPIVAERSMYFRYHSQQGFYCDGGHTKMGLNELSKSWYLAEGYVSPNFEEWVLLVNPNDAPAETTLSYYTPAGKHSEEKYLLAPRSRHTVYVNHVLGGATSDVSVGVDATQPIAVERSMYFNYNGWADDGHVSPGVSAPLTKWYFAEGSCYSGINEYVLLVNPEDSSTTVTATYLLGGGQSPFMRQYTLPPKSRFTINVNSDLSGLGSPAEVGLILESDQPVVAERAMYFNLGRADYELEPLRGGHVSLGASAPSSEWFFSEAYTGR